MLIDKTHRPWAILSAAILIVATAIYWREAGASPHGVTGGSLIGLSFGIVGSACMILAGLLAARKRIPTWQVGSAQFWLRGHIWLGLLSVPLILFHSGFGWGGLLENILWITFAIVIVSGVYGLVLQQLLPRWMTVRVPNETFGEQIPNRCRWLLVESDKLVAELAGKLDVDCTPVRGVAEDLAYLLGKLRNGKEEEDLQKFLGAIYVLPGANGQATVTTDKSTVKPESEAPAETIPAPTSPAPVNPTNPPTSLQPGGSSATSDEKPLSKIEQMRAAAAAKRAQQPVAVVDSAARAETAAVPETAPESTTSGATEPVAKPLSKIEQMRAAAAAKRALQPGEPSNPAVPAALPVGLPESPVAATEPVVKPLSKIEQMRAAAAAKIAQKAAAVPGPEPTTASASSPLVAPDVPVSVIEQAEKPLSKIEQMRAAAAAKRAVSGDAVPTPTPTVTSVARKTNPEPTAAVHPIPPIRPTTAVATATSQPNSRADEVRAFYLSEVRPFLEDRSRCLGSLGSEARARSVFAQLRASLPDDLHPALSHLETCCDERRQFELQRTLHRWLHGWLIVHIPATLVLLVLFAAHVVMALRVVPWSLPVPR